MNAQFRDLPPVPDSGKPLYLLHTGTADVVAAFTPALYQLRLIQIDGTATLHDLGYAGTRLLECLISSRGNALSREELTAYAWPDRVVGQGSLNQQIYTLRQLLCDDKARTIIQTLPRRGYLFDSGALIRVELSERVVQVNHSALAAAQSSTSTAPDVHELPLLQRQLLARAVPHTLMPEAPAGLAAGADGLSVASGVSLAEALLPQDGSALPDTATGTVVKSSRCPFAKTALGAQSASGTGAVPLKAMAIAFLVGLVSASLMLWAYLYSIHQPDAKLYEAAFPGALGAPVTLLAASPIAQHPARDAALRFAAGVTAANVELVLLSEHLVVNCTNTKGVNQAQLIALSALDSTRFEACAE